MQYHLLSKAYSNIANKLDKMYSYNIANLDIMKN